MCVSWRVSMDDRNLAHVYCWNGHLGVMGMAFELAKRSVAASNGRHTYSYNDKVNQIIICSLNKQTLILDTVVPLCGDFSRKKQ